MSSAASSTWFEALGRYSGIRIPRNRISPRNSSMFRSVSAFTVIPLRRASRIALSSMSVMFIPRSTAYPEYSR